jgi:hypothetical protein
VDHGGDHVVGFGAFQLAPGETAVVQALRKASSRRGEEATREGSLDAPGNDSPLGTTHSPPGRTYPRRGRLEAATSRV